MKIIEIVKPVDNTRYDGYGPSSEIRFAIADDDDKVVDDA